MRGSTLRRSGAEGRGSCCPAGDLKWAQLHQGQLSWLAPAEWEPLLTAAVQRRDGAPSCSGKAPVPDGAGQARPNVAGDTDAREAKQPKCAAATSFLETATRTATPGEQHAMQQQTIIPCVMQRPHPPSAGRARPSWLVWMHNATCLLTPPAHLPLEQPKVPYAAGFKIDRQA